MQIALPELTHMHSKPLKLLHIAPTYTQNKSTYTHKSVCKYRLYLFLKNTSTKHTIRAHLYTLILMHHNYAHANHKHYTHET